MAFLITWSDHLKTWQKRSEKSNVRYSDGYCSHYLNTEHLCGWCFGSVRYSNDFILPFKYWRFLVRIEKLFEFRPINQIVFQYQTIWHLNYFWPFKYMTHPVFRSSLYLKFWWQLKPGWSSTFLARWWFPSSGWSASLSRAYPESSKILKS